jgi:hypothetical protein
MATVVVAGLALAAALAGALEVSLLLDEPQALTPNASSSAAPTTPTVLVLFLTAHLRRLLFTGGRPALPIAGTPRNDPSVARSPSRQRLART